MKEPHHSNIFHVIFLTSAYNSISKINLFSPQIDDKEFDIPQVDTPPTLESILNELDDEEEPFVLEDTCVMSTDNMDTHSCDTSSLASSDSGDPAHLKTLTVDANTSVHGSVLRRSLLKGISAQIVSAAVSAHKHTVSAVIAVGTSHGLALVFDTNQALRLCLGTKTTGAEFGAVSALSINHDCSRLLCGFAKGQVHFPAPLTSRTTDSYHHKKPRETYLHRFKDNPFTDDPTLAVCNDSGGSVFELAFRRVMGMRSCDSRCLFSGSKGEVCCIEPLRAPLDFRDHPITQYSLLAMASLTKILVIGLKPSLKSDPASVPQLAWQFVAVQKAVNPILAFCKGDTVHFLLVKKEETGTIHVIKQRQLHLSCDIISLCWINSRTLVLVDSHEKLHVVDRPSQEVLETLDLEQVQLVYNSRHFKSLATGGNVSQALALVGEKACYQSVSSQGGQIVYLGTKSAHIMTLRVWRERIDCLLKQEHFVEALSLAWSFHEGTAKAVVGLFGDPVKRKSVVGDKMVEILFQFAEYALKKCPEHGKIQVMEQHFHDVVPVLVDYCLLLQRADLLFNQLYSRLLENTVAKGVFLESLESYIVADRVGHLTTPIMKDLLAHYHGNGMMDSLERCIVHLDVTSLDIQQVVQVCWTNHLYDAMIYVFNSGMNDYVTPMEKLFAVIGPPLREGRSLTDHQVVMGNKLLVYISCCLAGRAYPLGDIPEDLVVQVKNQVFDFLIRLHSADSTDEEEVFPFIRTLLHFDTREFLNVLAMTFEDFKNDKQALEYQQRTVDILLQVMVDNPDFTPSQVGGLFTFLARQLAKPDNTLFVNRKLFDQVLEFLCCPDDDSRHTERQQVLLELLQVGGVVQFNEERLLALAEKAKFYQICEFLYEKKHLYDRIIDCYLRDPLRKREIFSYVHNLLSMPSYSVEERQSVREKALQHMKVSTYTVKHLSFSLLQNDELIFKFLSSLLEPREGRRFQNTLPLQLELHELLLDLMCRFAPEGLLSFLQNSQHYRLEEAIQITQKRHRSEATAYLLEQKGDVHGAFSVLLEVNQSVKKLSRKYGTCRKSLLIIYLKEPNAKHTSEVLKELTMKVLNSMSSFIPLPAIIQRILQDPVYGKGKLAEIQGLILGMLDTFNYEQTLLETTTNLLNYDLHWSLAHLRATVMRGLHPRQDHCNICLQQYKRRQDSAEEIIVFSCGHLYHIQCLQQKESGCGPASERQQQWSCYKCSSSHGGKGGTCIELKRGRTTSLAQVCVCRTWDYNYLRINHVDSALFSSLPTLDPQQEQAWDQLRCLYRGQSKLSLLTELSHCYNEKAGPLFPAQGLDQFQLKLAPPPVLED
uniref:VPS8 subunit of CORVET complex n=1 Tax=Cynoglossus semilaevis TaxID=244447 RepID=A0A3P8WKK4_CYNSE